MAKRQTVWLSTMMILSLMVIGYYTVDDTLKPVPTATDGGKKMERPQDNNAPKDSQAGGGSKENGPKEQGKAADPKQAATTDSDWFAEQYIKNETDYHRKVEQLQQVIADSKTSTEQKAKAEQELKALSEFYDKAEKAENKVMAEGFGEALVTRDNGRVTVTVLANELSKEQAAKIFMIVSKELNIPASQIDVSYKP